MKIKEIINEKFLDKYLLNIKTINIATIILSIMFAIVFLFNGICAQTADDIYMTEYQKRMYVMDLYNKNFVYSSALDSETTTEKKEDALFSNAKEATIYAFEKLNSYTSYELVCTGVTTSMAAGQTVEIVFDQKFIKYESGTEFMQCIRHETKTNLGQSSAIKNLYKDGKAYIAHGDNIRMKDGILYADFGNYKLDTETVLNSIPLYIFDEDSVILSNHFTVNRNANGKIRGYYASVQLSTHYAVKYYAHAVKEQGGTSMPIFSNITVNVELDKDGHVVALTVDEDMSLYKKVVVDIQAFVNNKASYKMVSYNQTPSIAEPTLN